MPVNFEPLLSGLISHLDVFLINTSVFFFASNLLRSKKDSEKGLEAISTPSLSWDLMFTFKEHSGVAVTRQSVKEHSDWIINCNGKELTSKEYVAWLDYHNYNAAYETHLANDRKARWMAFYGAILLIGGTYFAIYKDVDCKCTVILILCIYVLAAVLLVGLSSIIVKHLFKIRPQPPKPDFIK